MCLYIISEYKATFYFQAVTFIPRYYDKVEPITFVRLLPDHGNHLPTLKELDWRAIFYFGTTNQVLFIRRGVSRGGGIYKQSLSVVSW